ncbi:MAG: hypothetical protein AB8G99_24695 [Planctomycetaceae bacterium]
MTIQILIAILGGLLLVSGAAWALWRRMSSRRSPHLDVSQGSHRDEAYRHLIWLTEYARGNQDEQFVDLCQKAFVCLTTHDSQPAEGAES